MSVDDGMGPNIQYTLLDGHLPHLGSLVVTRHPGWCENTGSCLSLRAYKIMHFFPATRRLFQRFLHASLRAVSKTSCTPSLFLELHST